MVAPDQYLTYSKYHDILKSVVSLHTTVGSYFFKNEREVSVSRRQRKLRVKYIDLT